MSDTKYFWQNLSYLAYLLSKKQKLSQVKDNPFTRSKCILGQRKKIIFITTRIVNLTHVIINYFSLQNVCADVSTRQLERRKPVAKPTFKVGVWARISQCSCKGWGLVGRIRMAFSFWLSWGSQPRRSHRNYLATTLDE